jgi:hypothetical protein
MLKTWVDYSLVKILLKKITLILNYSKLYLIKLSKKKTCFVHKINYFFKLKSLSFLVKRAKVENDIPSHTR